jgi:H+/Cl- antiporter ClcA
MNLRVSMGRTTLSLISRKLCRERRKQAAAAAAAAAAAGKMQVCVGTSFFWIQVVASSGVDARICWGLAAG